MIGTSSLTSAEKRAAESPDFKIPARSERESLRVGDFAKLVFLDRERMWVVWVEVVEVYERYGDYRGALRNDPVATPFRYGDEVLFGPEHVIAVDRGGSRATTDEHLAAGARRLVCRDCNTGAAPKGGSA